MSVQVRLLVEPFVALGVRTSKRFFSRVDSKVRLQVEVKTELLVADLALVGLLASVDKHVTFEFRCQEIACCKIRTYIRTKLLALRITYQFVPVDCHVLFKGGPIIKNFGARFQVTLKNSRLRRNAQSITSSTACAPKYFNSLKERCASNWVD